jgi:hypothetical protein
MIGDGIHEDALRYLVQQHAVREAVVGRINGGPAWGDVDSSGGPGRAPGAGALAALRTWASLTAVGKFADGIGLRGFVVEL